MSFVRQYGETPPRLWVEACDEMNDAECRNGLTAARRRGGSFPCNLGEFVELCGKSTRHGPRYLNPPIDPSKALPKPKADPAHVDNCLSRIRAKLADPAEEIEYDEYKFDVPARDPPLACTCEPGGDPCPACTEWDQRMRETS